MTDLITVAARATADRLTSEYGPGLAADVEAALHARGKAHWLGQYLDPVSLGSLIVAITTLAWIIYSDQRKTPDPSPGVVARHNARRTGQQDTERITEIVVTEIVQAAQDSR